MKRCKLSSLSCKGGSTCRIAYASICRYSMLSCARRRKMSTLTFEVLTVCAVPVITQEARRERRATIARAAKAAAASAATASSEREEAHSDELQRSWRRPRSHSHADKVRFLPKRRARRLLSFLRKEASILGSGEAAEGMRRKTLRKLCSFRKKRGPDNKTEQPAEIRMQLELASLRHL